MLYQKRRTWQRKKKRLNSLHHLHPTLMEAMDSPFGPQRDHHTAHATTADPSLSAAAAAVASVQDAWAENFHEPLPTNKEDRIKQALEFMRSEGQAHAADKNMKKHSIRQIAMFFQVPKSTLYDRLKHTAAHANPNGGPENTRMNMAGPTYSVSSRAHSQQMKLSPERELTLLHQLHDLCHALGNTLNLTHIRDFIISLVQGVTLGKKWVHNFNRRHDDAVVYGTHSSQYNVKMMNSKSCRSNYEYLWKCFVPLLQERISQLPADEPFFYITRTCIHQASMSSIFTCFKIVPGDLTMTMVFPPRVVLFPDYFGRIYLQLRDLKRSEDRHGYGVAAVGDEADEVERSSASSSSASSAGSRAIDKNEKDHGVDHNKINNQEKLQKEFKLRKLNQVFHRLYTDCCLHTGQPHNGGEITIPNGQEPLTEQASKEQVPLVIFEGFEDRYNWDPLICRSLVVLGKFLAFPWNHQLFQKMIAAELQAVVDNVAQSASITATQLSSMELDLDQVEINLDPFTRSLRHLLQSPTETIPNLNHNGVLVNDLFGSALPQSPPHTNSNTQSLAHTSANSSTPCEHHQQLENSTSANIFEDTTLAQLQEVVGMIEHNESQLYGELADGSTSKAALMEIFKKIKGIVPQ